MSSGVPPPPAPTNKIAEATLPSPVSSPPSAPLPWPWQGMQINFHDFLKSEVDPELSTIPLAVYLLFHDRMDVRYSYPSSFFFARQLNSVSHSDAVLFSAIFVWCTFQTGNSLQVLHRPLLQRLSSVRPAQFFIDFCGNYLARPCACLLLPWFSWAPRHPPHRGQAGPHLSDDLSFRRIYQLHRRSDWCKDPPMVVPWHVHPGALHYGRRDLALEEWARQPRLDPI
jgi:hypothetical protein